MLHHIVVVGASLAGLRAVLGGLHGLTAPSGAADPAQVAAAVRLRLGDGPR